MTPVRKIENEFIRLSDGCRIALALWIPEGPPAPAIFNMSPYGKKDMNAAGDEALFGYFAQHGYAGIRADMRGNGESTGHLAGKGTQPEWDDVCEILAWIEGQPWCDGNIGMWGFSWGGIEAFYSSVFRRPPQLKAIVAGGFSTNKYKDGPYYMGGVLLRDTMGWLTSFLSMRSRPPDPAVVGLGWKDEWVERIDRLEPIFDRFLTHQAYDAFWQRDAANEHIEKLSCPMLLWSGLLEPGMTNSAVEIVARAQVPTRLIVGPWAHKRPYEGRPGPAIGFLQETVRWYDHWLRGIDRDVLAPPKARVWMGCDYPTTGYFTEAPGAWLSLKDGLSSASAPRAFFLGDGVLDESPVRLAAKTHRSPQNLGTACGERMPYLSFRPSVELPQDQRHDDALSLCFDTAPRHAPLKIMGRAALQLDLAVDQPLAFVCARLCDVPPDGTSCRIALGMLNLVFRDGFGQAVPVVPGATNRVTVPFDFASYIVQPGHRLRLALSNVYWPLCWPSPRPVTMTAYAGRLDLPLLDDAAVGPDWVFEAPETAPGLQSESLAPPFRRDWVERHLTSGETVAALEESSHTRLARPNLAFSAHRRQRQVVADGDPLSARHEVAVDRAAARGTWAIATQTHAQMRATESAFHIGLSVRAQEGDRPVAEKTWDLSFPRLAV